MTTEQFNAVLEHLQPTEHPDVKVLAMEDYEQCLNLLASFDHETLEMAKAVNALHPGETALKVISIPMRDKTFDFCGFFIRLRGKPNRLARVYMYVYDSSKDVSDFVTKEILDFREDFHKIINSVGPSLPIKSNPNN